MLIKERKVNIFSWWEQKILILFALYWLLIRGFTCHNLVTFETILLLLLSFLATDQQNRFFPSVNGFRLYMFCTNHLFSLLTTDSLLPPLYTSWHAAFWFCISTTGPTPLILWICLSKPTTETPYIPVKWNLIAKIFYLIIYSISFFLLLDCRWLLWRS